ncbi:dual specificity protein phosphatase 2-like [Babylonia areolata]|uniref:dual specificity protein phosphatase 2-like n=1 Tax=Babylonia areolata TaxID=304850 RepID=UPI003FCFF242
MLLHPSLPVCAPVPYHHHHHHPYHHPYHHHHHHHHTSHLPASRQSFTLPAATRTFPSPGSMDRDVAAAVGISPSALLTLLTSGSGQQQQQQRQQQEERQVEGEGEGETLVLDCRPFLAYNRGHVAGALNVHCPPILRRRSGGVLGVEQVVPGRGERERLLAGGYTSVVLYDQSTRDVTAAAAAAAAAAVPGDLQSGSSPASNLLPVLSSLVSQQRSRLLHPGYPAPPRLYYLAGGYDALSQQCPFLCVTQQLPPFTPPRSQFASSALDAQPVEIVPHLLLGSGRHSSDLDLLRRLGVTALVNVSGDCENHFPSLFRYLRIPVRDSASADLSAWFPRANRFIDEVKAEGGRVLVHCLAGRSRSATICMAYLMYSRHLSLDAAFEHVRSRRQVIDPNLNFMRQLQDYQLSLDLDVDVDLDLPAHEASAAGLVTSVADTAAASFPQQQLPSSSSSSSSSPSSARTPREALAPISLPSSSSSPALSASLAPPPSPATATDAQCFFTFTMTEWPLAGGSLSRTPEIPLPS